MRGSTAGISDNFKGTKRSHYVFLSVLDTLFSVLIVAPAVVGYWRGTWELMEYHVYPQDSHRSAWVSLGIGLVGHFIFTVFQHQLTRVLHPDRHRILYYVASRLYTAAFGFFCVNAWRGPWKLLELYTGTDWRSVVPIVFVSIFALAAMRTLRNISAPPFAIIPDTCEGYFIVPTMFRVPGSRETALYVLDCLFSVVVIGTLVVFVWRGAWTLLDMYLYPDKPVISYWASLSLGYAIVLLTFSVQNPLKGLCSRIQGFWRVCVVDVYLFFSFCGTVNVWRGIWNLLNVYFLPEKPETSYWITHTGCLIILFLINCSNSILVRGVYIDAEEEGGKCVVFPCYYLRLFFQNKRKQKLQKQLQMLQAQQKVTVFPSSSTRCKTEDIQLNSANHHVVSLQSMMDSEEKPLH